MGREAGLNVPVHVASGDMDMSGDLKRALTFARSAERNKKEHSH